MQHKPCFDEECLGFIDLRKQAKIQWLQDPNQSNVNNLNNARPEASRHFRNKKMEYPNAKIKQLETNSKIKSIRELHRGIKDFKKCYWPSTNKVKNEKGELFTVSHSILASCRNHFLSY